MPDIKVSFSSIMPSASCMQSMDEEVSASPVDHLSESSLSNSKPCSCFKPILDFLSCLWENLKSLFGCCFGAAKSEANNVGILLLEEIVQGKINHCLTTVFNEKNPRFSDAIVAIFFDPHKPHIIYPYDKFNRDEFAPHFIKEYQTYLQAGVGANQLRTCTIGQIGKKFHCFTLEDEENEKVFDESQVDAFSTYLDDLFGQKVRMGLITTCATMGENPIYTIMLASKPYVSDGVSNISN